MIPPSSTKDSPGDWDNKFEVLITLLLARDKTTGRVYRRINIQDFPESDVAGAAEKIKAATDPFLRGTKTATAAEFMETAERGIAQMDANPNGHKYGCDCCNCMDYYQTALKR